MMTEPASPDCQQGKHTACSGDAWDHEGDRPATCACACHHVTRSAA